MDVSDAEIKDFQNTLLNWYKANARHFPWRNRSASNYERIISESLLQRTKAETVAQFFPGFIKKYPNWKQLAKATKKELQKTIQPLGLYEQRGKRIYELAQELKKRNGRFPKDFDEVKKLPLMGKYTANAYELFVLKRRVPLLDVNMKRILERYFNPEMSSDSIQDPNLQELSMRIVDHKRPIDINWAVLDLGAKVCIAKKPKCSSCPLSSKCEYYRNLQQDVDSFSLSISN